ncbi:MAG: hypothetical protein IJY25_04615 [Bacilli bacterium]|nr:hypothetical protein [Bacilli bacterium]
MNNKYVYEYRELKDVTQFSISFCYNRYDGTNQDEVFNKLILCITTIAKGCALSNYNIDIINEFLSLAPHNSRLDIREYLKEV